MENTGKVFFEDDLPEWYIALGDRWIGPLTAADVYQQILEQKITWAHFVWREGQSDWERICDIQKFQAAVPHAPGKSLTEEVKEAAKPVVKKASSSRKGPPPTPDADSEKVWFLFYNDTQFGPFSQEEVERFLQIGKIHGQVHVWKDGMENWTYLENVPEFKQAQKVPRSPKASIKENRSTPRRPLVAKMFLANDEAVVAGVCRDISVGGMQVLTDRIPGEVGSQIKMNVSPSSLAAKITIGPFVAEGVIVRVLEDRRGFSFRFKKISETAKQAIDAYINSSE